MRTYQVQGRNGYHAVDEFVDGKCRDTVIAGVSRKVAERIAGALADAYRHGTEDQAGTS